MSALEIYALVMRRVASTHPWPAELEGADHAEIILTLETGSSVVTLDAASQGRRKRWVMEVARVRPTGLDDRIVLLGTDLTSSIETFVVLDGSEAEPIAEKLQVPLGILGGRLVMAMSGHATVMSATATKLLPEDFGAEPIVPIKSAKKMNKMDHVVIVRLERGACLASRNTQNRKPYLWPCVGKIVRGEDPVLIKFAPSHGQQLTTRLVSGYALCLLEPSDLLEGPAAQKWSVCKSADSCASPLKLTFWSFVSEWRAP